jgi:hypothetical protein
VSSPREMSLSKGAWETNVPEEETAAVRRDGGPLASAARQRRQEEAAAEKHQAAAGEPNSSPGKKTANLGIPHTVCPDTEPGGQVGRDGCRPDMAETAQVKPPPTCSETGEKAIRRIGGLRRKLIGPLRNGSEHYTPEKESAASRRRAELHVNVNVGDQTTAQSRAVYGENPGAAQEELQNEAD